jgi:hypothetical protein
VTSAPRRAQRSLQAHELLRKHGPRGSVPLPAKESGDGSLHGSRPIPACSAALASCSARFRYLPLTRSTTCANSVAAVAAARRSSRLSPRLKFVPPPSVQYINASRYDSLSGGTIFPA